MKSFYPVLYLCFLFGLLPFLGSCSEENESSGTIEMNQLPGQTTKSLEEFWQIIEYIKEHISPDATFEFYDTICRQVCTSYSST